MMPKVGIGVILIKESKVLMGKRKGDNGGGTWAFPGGHLEFNEGIFDCARREVYEETRLKIKNLREGPYTNNVYPDEGRHYVTLFVVADYGSGTVTNAEPDRCEGWEWFEWDMMPSPLFLSVKNLVDKGYRPF